MTYVVRKKIGKVVIKVNKKRTKYMHIKNENVTQNLEGNKIELLDDDDVIRSAFLGSW